MVPCGARVLRVLVAIDVLITEMDLSVGDE